MTTYPAAFCRPVNGHSTDDRISVKKIVWVKGYSEKSIRRPFKRLLLIQELVLEMKPTHRFEKYKTKNLDNDYCGNK